MRTVVDVLFAVLAFIACVIAVALVVCVQVRASSYDKSNYISCVPKLTSNTNRYEDKVRWHIR